MYLNKYTKPNKYICNQIIYVNIVSIIKILIQYCNTTKDQ